MLLQKNLAEIALQLAHYIDNNTNIKSFCQEQFQKELKIYAGEVLRKTIPSVDETPYLVIRGMEKTEGLLGYAEYTSTIVVGIGSESNTFFADFSENIKMYDGYDVLGKLVTLIQKELNKRNDGANPLRKCEVNMLGAIEPDGSHWAATMVCTWRMIQTINTATEEEF